MTSLFERCRGRFSAGFVLAFHDIRAQRLAELVDALSPAEIVPLSDLVERSKKGKSTAGLFAITLDDGIGNTVRDLAGLFQQRGWPGTFYISTDYIDGDAGLSFQWWRNLVPFLPRRKVRLEGREIDLSLPGAVNRLSREMERMWHSCRQEAYMNLTMDLVELVLREHELDIAAIRPPESISWPEVVQLSRDPLLSFESHGVSHTAMSALTDSELEAEMKNSRDLIASYTGRSCRHFAYPFGSNRSIGPRAVEAARRFYDSAVTMSLGHVDSAHPWLLPRIPLYTGNHSWFARLKLLSTYASRHKQAGDLPAGLVTIDSHGEPCAENLHLGVEPEASSHGRANTNGACISYGNSTERA
jgi:peptidoglycan/xylan/chitin deacetylase (PgdA/CDA1 family)